MTHPEECREIIERLTHERDTEIAACRLARAEVERLNAALDAQTDDVWNAKLSKAERECERLRGERDEAREELRLARVFFDKAYAERKSDAARLRARVEALATEWERAASGKGPSPLKWNLYVSEAFVFQACARALRSALGGDHE